MQIADSSQSVYLQSVTDYNWSKKHFADPSHLNEGGNLIFARLLYQQIKTIMP